MKWFKKVGFALFALVISCGYKVDDSDIFKVADAIDKSLARNDRTIFEQIYSQDQDIEPHETNRTISEFSSLYSREMKLLKIDTGSEHGIGHISGKTSIREIINPPKQRIYMFYGTESNFYLLAALFDQNTEDNSYYIHRLRIIDLNKECADALTSPYNPMFLIDFKQLSWNTSYNGRTFKSGTIELQNRTGRDIDYMKFRVILKRSNKTFYNQTVESFKKIFKGDIVKVDIPGMRDFYTGFYISSNEIIFEPQLIEVKPGPEPKPCREIEELKELVY